MVLTPTRTTILSTTMKLKIVLTTFLFIMLFSCISHQFTLDNLPEKQLIFGKGGGMTGAADTYILLENGQLFHTNSLTKKSEELKSISKNKSDELFLQLEVLQLAEMDFNHPGNIYYFIENMKTGTSSKVVWGSMEHEVDPLCKTLYNNLIDQLK